MIEKNISNSIVKVAAIQMKMSENSSQNISNAEKFVRQASQKGSNIILLPELFETLYFCKDKDSKYFSYAQPHKNNPLLNHFSMLAKELGVVILVSYFEKETLLGNNENYHDKYYNSLVVMDSDGSWLDNYRKTHIPDGPGYEEKFYFEPGNSGFKVYKTTFGTIGVGICWDQWFSECARTLTLMGAELLFYPTAIGSEPEIHLDSKEHWQRVQMGHAAANTTPVIAANRIGVEIGESCELTFYGSSFMTDFSGAKIAEASRDKEEIIYAEYNLDENAKIKEYWALLKDRRPECYEALLQKD
jgi:N-carbamoylputrescine amidase